MTLLWYLALFLLSHLDWPWAERLLIGETYTRSSCSHVPLDLARPSVVSEHLELDRRSALSIGHQLRVDHVNESAITALEVEVFPG